MGTPPTPQGILQKKAIFLLFVRVINDKFAPSLGPVPLPLTPPEPKPLHPPPSPCPASLTPRPPSQLQWVPPTHQANFPDPFPWNQGPWSTPPSTRPAPVGTPPHPTGHPSKKNIFLLFVRVSTTHVAKFAPSLRPVPLPPTPPQPKPLHPPDRQANPSLTPSLDLLLFGTANQAPTPSPHSPASLHQASSGVYPPRPPGQLRWVPLRHPTGHPSKTAIFLLFLRVNDKNTAHVAKFAATKALAHQSTPRSTRPAPVGTPPTPQLYALNTTHVAKFALPGARAPTTYPPGTEALATPRRALAPPSQPFPDPFPGLAPVWNSHGARVSTTYPPGTEALAPPS